MSWIMVKMYEDLGLDASDKNGFLSPEYVQSLRYDEDPPPDMFPDMIGATHTLLLPYFQDGWSFICLGRYSLDVFTPLKGFNRTHKSERLAAMKIARKLISRFNPPPPLKKNTPVLASLVYTKGKKGRNNSAVTVRFSYDVYGRDLDPCAATKSCSFFTLRSRTLEGEVPAVR
jgi:hypothetical protein